MKNLYLAIAIINARAELLEQAGMAVTHSALLATANGIEGISEKAREMALFRVESIHNIEVA